MQPPKLMVKSDELTATTEHLTLKMRCRINRCRYNRVRLYVFKMNINITSSHLHTCLANYLISVHISW